MTGQFTIVYDELSEQVGSVGAQIVGKVLALSDEQGEAHIPLEYLARITRTSLNTLRNEIRILQTMGYIEYVKGDGRGHASVFKKGAKIEPFTGEKGCKKRAKKGAKIEPIKYNIKYKIDDKKRASARINQSKKNNNNQSVSIMSQFEQFWQGFFFGAYAKYEAEQAVLKERCRRAFEIMSEQRRAALLKDIRSGKRYDKTHYVLWYIQNYESELKKGTRLTRDQYYAKFGDDQIRNGWKFWKPQGYERYIFERV